VSAIRLQLNLLVNAERKENSVEILIAYLRRGGQGETPAVFADDRYLGRNLIGVNPRPIEARGAAGRYKRRFSRFFCMKYTSAGRAWRTASVTIES